MKLRFTTILVGVSASLMVLGGCRTYGGYGSEEALYRQIQRANEEFAQDFDRMIQGRADIEARAVGISDGDRIASSLGATLELHEVLLAQHRAMAEELSLGSSHRALRRVYGAIVTDQEVVRSMYRRMQDAVNGRLTRGDSTVHANLPYSVVPARYHSFVGNTHDVLASALPTDTSAMSRGSSAARTPSGGSGEGSN